MRPLAEKDAVPKQDLDTAIAAEEVAVAEVDVQAALLMNAKITEEVGMLTATALLASSQASVDLANLDLDYCTITGPIDGLIGRTEVNVGNLVGKGSATHLVAASGWHSFGAARAPARRDGCRAGAHCCQRTNQ